MGEARPAPTFGVAVFPQYSPAEFAAYCRKIDDRGFERLWVPDERFFRDLAVEMTLAALNTRRVLIGSAVTDPFIRHPALTATMIASIDEVSHGRVTAGLGAGISGFQALHILQARPALAIREAVALMRQVWSASGPVTFEGKTTSFTNGRLDFTPRPDIPVWIAGRGPAVLQLAGEVAEGVMIGGLASAPGLAYAEKQIARGLSKANRESNTISRAVWLHTAVADDGHLARNAVRTIVVGALISSPNVLDEIGIPVPAALVEELKGITYGVNNPEMQRVARTLDDDMLAHFSVAGTVDEVVPRIRELGQSGIDHIAVVPWLADGQSLDDFIDRLAQAMERA